MPKASKIERRDRHQRGGYRAGRAAFVAMSAMLSVPNGAVEIGGGDQEQRRREQVEDRVFGRAVDLRAFRAEDQKAERGDQEHLEPDVEIEDVAGQERSVDAGHQQHQERIEAVAPPGRVDVAAQRRRRRSGRRTSRPARSRAPSGSAAKEMPNGGSQRPIVIASGPSVSTRARSAALTASDQQKAARARTPPASAGDGAASAGARPA